MRKLVAVGLVFASIATARAAGAQEQPSKIELYGGYEYVRFNINANVEGQPPFNGNGGGAAIPYLFGPRLSLRHRMVTPFAQVLVGGVVTSSGIEELGWQNHFAMTAGGGIDFRVSRHLSVRPVQAEYFMTKVPDGLSNRQNNFRYSAGISLLLGGRRAG
jgi:hypothetical protein